MPATPPPAAPVDEDRTAPGADGPPADAPVLVVLCADAADRPAGLAPLEDLAAVRWTDAAGLPAALAGAAGLVVWDFFSPALRDAWDAAGSLRWVHVAAAGVDSLLFPGLVASDVVVTNARGVFERPIAEYVLGAVLAVAKDLRGSDALQREQVWRHRETRRVQGQTAMVVGTGPIGREVARLLRAVGVQVRGAGRTARTGDPDLGDVVASAELARHVGDVDHLVVVAPLTEATRGLVDADVLAAMYPGAHLVNVGRGACVVEDDLVAALRCGHLGAATLDVVQDEPLPPGHPLWTTRGVALSAHLSGDVVGWRQALAAQVVARARTWVAGEELTGAVDKQRGYVPGP